MSYYNFVSNDVKVAFFPDLSICPICGAAYDKKSRMKGGRYPLKCGHGIFYTNDLPVKGLLTPASGILIYPHFSDLVAPNPKCREIWNKHLDLARLKLQLRDLRRALYLIEQMGAEVLFDNLWYHAYVDTYSYCFYNKITDTLVFVAFDKQHSQDFYNEDEYIPLIQMGIDSFFYKGWEKDLTLGELEDISGFPYNGDKKQWRDDILKDLTLSACGEVGNDPPMKQRAKKQYKQEFINPKIDDYNIKDYKAFLYQIRNAIGKLKAEIKKLSGGI